MIKDMTHGNERKALIFFSIPMILGNLIQQLYNVADTLIVGRVLGTNALGAVGSAYSLMVLLTSIILGLCMGSGIVFSQLFGAKRIKDLKTSIWNSFVFTAIITIFINILSFLLLDKLLLWMNIPIEVLKDTRTYLNIIFMGIGFTFIYNFISSILRSIGNSVMPLIFLAISSVLNVVLDIVFILPLNMGVGGAAIATIISQGVSAVAIMIYFLKKAPQLCPGRENMYYDKGLLKLIMSNSILNSIQQSIMNFGILMIQGLVNSFGVHAMAAFAAVVKIDSFAYMPAQDFGNAFATYIAQNYGARKTERIKTGIKEAVKISGVFCLIVSVAVYIFAKELMLMFIQPSEVEVISIGIQYLRIEGMCYIGIGGLFLLYAFYRGLGKAQMSIVLTVISLGSRVVLAYALAPIQSIGLLGIWWSIPIGWLLADIIGFGYLMFKRESLFSYEDTIERTIADIV